MGMNIRMCVVYVHMLYADARVRIHIYICTYIYIHV